WSAADRRSLCQASAGPQGFRCADEPPAAEGEHGGRHPCDRRQQYSAVPGFLGAVVRAVREHELAGGYLPVDRSWSAVEHPVVQRRYHLLLLLLHGIDVQSERRCGKSEEVRCVYPWNPAW